MAITKVKKEINNRFVVHWIADYYLTEQPSKRLVLQKNDEIQISLAIDIAPPRVFRVLSPTRNSYQRIRGFRASENVSIEINGTTAGIRYNGREFVKQVELTEGLNVFQIRSLVGSQKSEPVTVYITRDTQVPTSYILIDGRTIPSGLITNQSVAISFYSSKEGPIYYAVDGTNGVFHSQFEVEDEGQYQIQWHAEDNLGNAESLRSFDFIIDKTPPDIPVIDLDNLPEKTNQTEILVSGTSNGEFVRLNNIESAVVNGNWEVAVSLSEGINILEAVALDLAGNVSSPANASVFLDTIPPPKPGLLTDIQKTNITDMLLLGSQTHEAVQILVNSEQAILQSPIRWRFPVTLEEGQNHFEVVAIDDVGNVSEPLIFDIELDTIPPDAPIIDPVISPTNNPIVTLTGTATTDIVRIGHTDIPVNNGIWMFIVELPGEALNEIKVIAIDDVGNKSEPAIASIFLDREAPPPPAIDALPLYTNISPITMTGTKSIDTQEILTDSLSVTYPSSTTWAAVVNLVEGVNEFEVRAADELGNTSGPSFTRTVYFPDPPEFTVDTYDPISTRTSVIITGTRDIGTRIDLLDPTKGFVQYPDTISSGSLWKATLYLELGPNSFDLRAKDKAGNFSLPQTIQVERVAPVSAKNFFISSVFAFGNPVEDLPILLSEDIHSILLFGEKSPDTNVTASSGSAFLPDGVAGTTWQCLLPMSKLRASPLELKMISPQSELEIVITDLVRAKSLFIGTISVKIGGNVEVELKQSSQIVMTDYQYNNTPSPVKGILLKDILRIESRI